MPPRSRLTIEERRRLRAEYARKWRQQHPESARASERKWRESHRDARRAIQKRWRAKNPESVRQTRAKAAKVWREKNPERAREISIEAQRRYRERHPERVKEIERRYREKRAANAGPRPARPSRSPLVGRSATLRRKYGVTHADYERMLAAQRGKCAICGDSKPGTASGYFHVDHDHGSKVVRGLLCRPCNTMLGFGRDDPARLRAGAAYIEHFAVPLFRAVAGRR